MRVETRRPVELYGEQSSDVVVVAVYSAMSRPIRRSRETSRAYDTGDGAFRSPHVSIAAKRAKAVRQHAPATGVQVKRMERSETDDSARSRSSSALASRPLEVRREY